MKKIFLTCKRCGETIKTDKPNTETIPCPACRRVGQWDIAEDE